MEVESLFSSTRWEIIKALSKESLSPIELAEQIGTTSANISQQLRLLELGGLVDSERTSNVDRGKPRVIYSLAGDNALLVIASNSFADKKILPLTLYHKFLMRSWFIENPEHHRKISEVYTALQDKLSDISVVAAKSQYGDLVIDIVSKDTDGVKKMVSHVKGVKFNVKADFKKLDEDYVMLYDPEGKIEVKK